MYKSDLINIRYGLEKLVVLHTQVLYVDGLD